MATKSTPTALQADPELRVSAVQLPWPEDLPEPNSSTEDRMTAGVRAMTDEQRRRREVVRRAGDSWYNIRVDEPVPGEPVGPTKARVDLFDEIGMGGVSAKDFNTDLNTLDVEEIDLHLNSPGGEVFDAVAILNTLRSHKAHVTVTVDGVAASSASFIAMGGDTVVMAPNSELMIHEAWGVSIGNAADLRALADRLDQVSDNIASIYASKAGGSVGDWRKVMKAETWYSAQEAVAAGLADKAVPLPTKPAKKSAASPHSRFDLSIYNYAGRDHAPAPFMPSASDNQQEPPVTTPDPGTGEVSTDATATNGGAVVATTVTPEGSVEATVTPSHQQADPAPPAGPPAGSAPPSADPPTSDPAAAGPAEATPAAPAAGEVQNRKGAPMELDPVKLREVFGLNPSASDEEVRAAVVATGYASLTPLSEGAPDILKGRERPQAKLDPSVQLVDSSILDQLRKDAASGVEAYQQLRRQERDQAIKDAINCGKFAPARKEHWEKAWDKDPEGTKAAIGSLSPGLIPVSMNGYLTHQTEGTNADDQLYGELYGTSPRGDLL